MKIKVSTSRTGSEPIELCRVNVLLGANGTGKSKLLNELRGKSKDFIPDYKIVNIEGGRAIQLYDTLQLDAKNFNQYRTYEQTHNHYTNKRSGTLQSRLFDGLKSLEQLGENQKIEHSDKVTEWQRAYKDGATDSVCPRRPMDPMDTVFEAFTDIFPTIRLSYSSKDKRLRCTKNGERYGPTSLSDGEKQVFSILVDVVELAEEESILFVDEPELNLNPGLANRLWNSIESMLPKSVFIYATHSVSFSMRESVDKLYVISNIDDNIQELSDLSDLKDFEKEELLGNISSLLAHRKTLLVEGRDESFDIIFYSWVVSDRDVFPAAVGGCEDVVAIVKRKGIWARVSERVQVLGVVDRDYKSETSVEELRKQGVLVLEYHEAESFLCEPSLIAAVGAAIGTLETPPSEPEVLSLICQFVEQRKIEIVAKRVAAQLSVRIGVSVPSSVLKKIDSEHDMRRLIMEDVERQKDHVSSVLDQGQVDRLISDEMSLIAEAISSRDVAALLRIAPGKELLKQLAKQLGCVDSNAVVRAARSHLNLEDFSALRSLKQSVNGQFLSMDHP